jgi:hypothetical protein
VSSSGAYPFLLAIDSEALLAYEVDGGIAVKRIQSNISADADNSGE